MPDSEYFDLQLNGYKGVDFNSDDLSAEGLHHACSELEADGVAGVLATIITDSLRSMEGRLSRIAELRRHDPLADRLIVGIHIEGPFLNETPGYAGAHPIQAIRPADVDSVKRLIDAADGLVRLVTLAPERDPQFKVTRYLAERGIVVSAGHCDPTVDQLRGAIDSGLSMFTHLGNGCPMLLPRHDNIIQRALSLTNSLRICFIGDGVHVPYVALGNYLRIIGADRAIIVSDGMSAAGLGPGRYTLGGQDVEIGEDLVAWSPDRSHLMGATATMPQIAEQLRKHLRLTTDDIHRMMVANPRQSILPQSLP